MQIKVARIILLGCLAEFVENEYILSRINITIRNILFFFAKNNLTSSLLRILHYIEESEVFSFLEDVWLLKIITDNNSGMLNRLVGHINTDSRDRAIQKFLKLVSLSIFLRSMQRAFLLFFGLLYFLFILILIF